jgi:hypothetical protein
MTTQSKDTIAGITIPDTRLVRGVSDFIRAPRCHFAPAERAALGNDIARSGQPDDAECAITIFRQAARVFREQTG